MKKMDDRIKFAQVLRDLMDAQYKRNRGTLAKRVHMSPSALSQYTAGAPLPHWNHWLYWPTLSVSASITCLRAGEHTAHARGGLPGRASGTCHPGRRN